ncbi:MAG: hypothetical protein ACD_38C00172G0003 [uncultured bacterium]|uniref:Uncharacterized protein n=1 Tax=Candidatus Daviesbacteria bacterium GW2011_GWC2_40_12 TaxID=1618431 RepID=A0A0G0QPL1_9BACT|nr:MAG: hypothetical protein ACD_38C00172G0003 [uncultured bacterium]KKR16855.1 MAG: hypothetical protein UT45_C0004G0186 [Candidatus Daviesbacteria bacterium GW2011_GWA2_39_33]KKR22767.1 MAG: hypothetical protein UT54_C0062G0006 [Candidatus Daviesbacteria bacterium GW2011_GWB1_39_5]KKR42364.1 MAG: hypothetical protein UT77_C0002G0017 [Candidatus Daviesbacteria bacterium GW2011_GWC2_40_12]
MMELEQRLATFKKLQKLEAGLDKIVRLTENIGSTPIVSSLDLSRFDENNPAQTEDLLKTAIKAGIVIERLNVKAKPIIEGKIREIKGGTEGKRMSSLFDEAVNALNQSSLVPARIVGKAARSVLVYNTPRNSNGTPEERVFTQDGTLTKTEGAILAIAIAEASLKPEAKKIFTLDSKFSGFFGKLCSSLPQKGSGEMSVSSYNEAKRGILNKAALMVADPQNNHVAREVKLLFDWINSCTDQKDVFYEAILAVDDCSDATAVIDLRSKFRSVMQARFDEKFARDLVEVTREGEEELKKHKELEEARKLKEAKRLAEAEIKKQQEKDRNQLAAKMEKILVGLWSREAPYIEMLNEAVAITPGLEGKKRLGLVEKALAIANLEHRQATELNFTEEEMKVVKDVASDIYMKRIKEPKK